MPVFTKEALERLPIQLGNFFKKFPPENPNAWTTNPNRQNPFLATRNPQNGLVINPYYSNRRQAEIYKEARLQNLDNLLPQQMSWQKDSTRHILKGLLNPKGKISERKRDEILENRRLKLSESLKKTSKFKNERVCKLLYFHDFLISIY